MNEFKKVKGKSEKAKPTANGKKTVKKGRKKAKKTRKSTNKPPTLSPFLNLKITTHLNDLTMSLNYKR